MFFDHFRNLNICKDIIQVTDIIIIKKVQFGN